MDVDLILHALEELLGESLKHEQTFSAGQHASTVLLSGAQRKYVVKAYPAGDDAAQREAVVLAHVEPLGPMAPHAIAWMNEPQPLIATVMLPGGIPDLARSLVPVGRELGKALARIHCLPRGGFGLVGNTSVSGTQPIQALAHREWEQKFPSGMAAALADSASSVGSASSTFSICDELVFSHGDFWSGNALWEDGVLTGVVDWSGAGVAPRGMDVAWARQDLMLLGSIDAADALMQEYFSPSVVPPSDIAWWDRQMAARATANVETWAPNYAGVGRNDLTPSVLRQRMDHWTARLLDEA